MASFEELLTTTYSSASVLGTFPLNEMSIMLIGLAATTLAGVVGAATTLDGVVVGATTVLVATVREPTLSKSCNCEGKFEEDDCTTDDENEEDRGNEHGGPSREPNRD